MVYEIGRREPFLDHKKKAKDGKPGVSLDWFNMLYQVLLGQEKGPRFGSFVAVYGLQNTIDMIDGALARSGVASRVSRASAAKTRDPANHELQSVWVPALAPTLPSLRPGHEIALRC